jgi:hypothetical protein
MHASCTQRSDAHATTARNLCPPLKKKKTQRRKNQTDIADPRIDVTFRLKKERNTLGIARAGGGGYGRLKHDKLRMRMQMQVVVGHV